MQKKNWTKPAHHLFLLGAVLMSIVAIVLHQIPLDIANHDTYYVLSYGIILFPFVLVLGIIWLIYQLSKGFLLSKYLTILHFVLSISFIVFFMLSFGQSGFTNFINTLFYKGILSSLKHGSPNYYKFYLLFLLWIFNVFIFIANWVGGLIKRGI